MSLIQNRYLIGLENITGWHIPAKDALKIGYFQKTASRRVLFISINIS